MKKQLLCAIAVAAAGFGLSGVNAHAQDVASDVSTQAVSAVPAEPAATPAPTPRPSFLSDDGKVSLFVGYSFLNTNLTEGNTGYYDYCNAVCYGRTQGSGFAVSGTYFINPNFGLTADFSGSYGGVTNNDDGDKYHLPQNSYYILFGPTVAKKIGRVELSAHALAGIARLWAAEDYVSGGENFREASLPWNTGFAVGVGGSADVMFSHGWGWRVVQADFLWSDGSQSEENDYPYTEHVSIEAVRISTGIVFNLGHAR